MTVNPLGYVCPFDGGNARIITGIAFATVSGGQFCFASGAQNVVTSGLSSLAVTDIGIVATGSGACFNGVALDDASSGGAVAIATRGCVIVAAGGTVTNGMKVMALDASSVANAACVSGADVIVQLNQALHVSIGRALTSAASGGFCLVDLNP